MIHTNFKVFADTQKRIKNSPELTRMTKQSSMYTKVYNDHYQSKKSPRNKEMRIGFEESLTLISAYRYTDCGKRTAVLNFANPVEPGGGVLRGANAQEEYLCRASNLYNVLTSVQAEPYYNYNQNLLDNNSYTNMFIGSDKVLWTPEIVFFKEDCGYHPGSLDGFTQEYTEHWRSIDVLTCAAPLFMVTHKMVREEDLEKILTDRIINIFEVAIDNDVEVLVLGAFGCGAFRNPPQLVARVFRKVLLNQRYRNAFEEVVFAVKRTGNFCENIEAFEIAFSNFPEECMFSTERNKI